MFDPHDVSHIGRSGRSGRAPPTQPRRHGAAQYRHMRDREQQVRQGGRMVSAGVDAEDGLILALRQTPGLVGLFGPALAR